VAKVDGENVETVLGPSDCVEDDGSSRWQHCEGVRVVLCGVKWMLIRWNGLGI